MSVGPENRFRASIHRLLPVSLHHEKMNNPYRGGTADDWYSGDKADLWVEYKWENNPLSALQVKWLRDRHKEGRKVYVIRGLKDGGVILKHPDSWEVAKLINPTILSKKEIAKWLEGETMRSYESKTETGKRSRRKLIAV